ncbi:response regulator transcription factor [Pseudomonas matsuisoli]|uniref:DNA-binding response regulator n=1 Tax=Pseudomonas matsuisoli TaxID=1515666 RepID=A0A917PTB8_9PSED|nr:response regulator transcription factor [Pseudomonas matsuisoli]GGJ90829.1 DNA-binding response regulator [Pseudomonas matsuisoli]
MLSANRSSARILAIEDDPVLAAHLVEHLSERGFQVALGKNGEQGLALANAGAYDLILMDILMPGASGLEVLASLREAKGTPVILMSALGAEQDRIAGFSQGADDYLPKPFSMSELDVRIEAVLRRVAYERGENERQPHDPDLNFDDSRSDVRYAGAWAKLTPTEFRLLELFSRHAEEVLSKAFLYQQVLHRGYAQHDRSLDMHVSNIRRKLQKLGYGGRRLESVWGRGYVLTRPES